MNYVAEPLKRIEIRNLANNIRQALHLTKTLYFPVIGFLEMAMPLLYEDFHFEVVPKDEFPYEKHAEMDVLKHCIRIREDIYEGAVNGSGRDRMTIVHEIAHYILIIGCGIKFNMSFNNNSVKKYMDPEWQAKALAGELMCPNHLIGGMSVEKIMKECGVSEQAAQYNLRLTKGVCKK